MIATGLRLGDVCALGYDPLVFDNDANPYIRYWNHKMRREAYVAISQPLLDGVRVQQQRTAQRFSDQTADYLSTPAPHTLPAAGLKLTPRATRNPDGTRGFVGTTYQQQLRTFQATARISDEAGRPVTITAQQWRHTFATGLINRGVRLEVVKQLLDHASLEMSSHYARLLDTTIRAEWEAGRGPDDDSGHLLPTDVEWANLCPAKLQRELVPTSDSFRTVSRPACPTLTMRLSVADGAVTEQAGSASSRGVGTRESRTAPETSLTCGNVLS